MSNTPTDQHAFILGQIHGELKGIKEAQQTQAATLQTMDTRLRDQEVTSAKFGALSGGLVGIGIALMTESLKNWLAGGGPKA